MKTKKVLSIVAALVMALTLFPALTPPAYAATPEYIITQSGGTFYCNAGGGVVDDTDIFVILGEIVNQGDAECIIQFGDGTSVIDLGTDNIVFDPGWSWGNVTITGNITSSPGMGMGVIMTSISMLNSTANITNTDPDGPAVIVNDGDFLLYGGRLKAEDNSVAVYNMQGWVFIYGGTIDAKQAIGNMMGELHISGNFTNRGEIYNSGGIIDINNGVTLTNEGMIIVDGGWLVVRGTLDNDGGVIENDGIISVEAGGWLENNGELINNDTIDNKGTIKNEHELYNQSGAVFNNFDTVINNAELYNDGTFTNDGTLLITENGNTPDGISGDGEIIHGANTKEPPQQEEPSDSGGNNGGDSISGGGYTNPDMTPFYGVSGSDPTPEQTDPEDSPSDWAKKAVDKALELKLIPTRLQGSWSNDLSRADFCALAVKLYEHLNGSEITTLGNFDDTTDLSVRKLAGLGIVKGDGSGKFDPSGTFTREMAITLMYNMMVQLGNKFADAEPSFADAGDISPWAKQAIGALQKAKIVSGDGQYFNPKLIFTREMGVVTVMNFLE